MWSWPPFHTEQLKKSPFLAFEIESNITIYSLKSLSAQQFVKNFHLEVQNSMKYDDLRFQPHFHAAM